MTLKVNGKEITVENTMSIKELLAHLGYQNAFVAVAINQTCVPRNQFDRYQLATTDEVEILAPMAGG